MTTVLEDGREITATLHPGDAHGVRLGEAHWCRAGPAGCRFLAVGFPEAVSRRFLQRGCHEE
jgi:hypothetical protein